jgi:hypothetical protein
MCQDQGSNYYFRVGRYGSSLILSGFASEIAQGALDEAEESRKTHDKSSEWVKNATIVPSFYVNRVCQDASSPKNQEIARENEAKEIQLRKNNAYGEQNSIEFQDETFDVSFTGNKSCVSNNLFLNDVPRGPSKNPSGEVSKVIKKNNRKVYLEGSPKQ